LSPTDRSPIWQTLRQFLDDLESEGKEGATSQQALYGWWEKDKKLVKLVDNPRMPR
jgi:hypothetical protein